MGSDPVSRSPFSPSFDDQPTGDKIYGGVKKVQNF